MPTNQGQEFGPEWDGWPPSMIAGDLRVWKLVRVQMLKDALRVFYDVRVGDGQPAPPGTDETFTKLWTGMTQRRIDVLIEYAAYWRLIELREDAHEQEIGRLEMYEMLYGRDPINKKTVVLTLISSTHSKDIEDLARLKGIEYIIIR